MNNELGWVKDYRKTEGNPIVTKDNDYFRVWYYLLHHANSKVVEGLFKKEKISIQPGQFLTGRDKISNECKVEKHKVDRILKCFEKEKQIEQQTSSKGRLITILNWNKYQTNEKQIKKQVRNKRETNEKQVSTNKNIKNKRMKEYKNIPPKSPKGEKECGEDTLFNLFWNAYPKKIAKVKVEKWFDQNKPSEQIVNSMVEKITKLKNTRQWQKEEGRYIPYPINWLNAKGWEDEINSCEIPESDEEEITRLKAEVERRKASGEWE